MSNPFGNLLHNIIYFGHWLRALGVETQPDGVKVTPHMLRRGFAVEHRGMSVWDLQRLLGHASVETTRLYVETEEDDLLESYLENYSGSNPKRNN